MNRAFVLSMLAITAACGGTATGPGTGGSGGATTTSSATTSSSTTSSSTTSSSTTSSSTSTTTSATCALMGNNVVDNAADSTFTACTTPVVPLPNEDGTFTVTVFGPFPQGFELAGFTFIAWDEGNAGVTDPWTAAAIVVPAGADPLAVDPSASAAPYPLTTIDASPAGADTYRRYSITLTAPSPVAPCESVVIALRNTVGPPRSGVAMCGGASAHPETNQWWNLDGTMREMASYGADFDRDWSVSLTPAP